MQVIPAQSRQAQQWQARVVIAFRVGHNRDALIRFQKKRRLAGELIAVAGPIRMQPDVGCELSDRLAMQASGSKPTQDSRRNAGPIQEMPLTNDKAVIAARIENRRKSWRERIELTQPDLGEADPYDDLVALDRDRSPADLGGCRVIVERKFPKNGQIGRASCRERMLASV